MNRIVLVGRLCRDPALSYNNEMAICKFYLAVDKPYNANKSGAKADFLPCVFFGTKAETVANYFHKGDKIALQGRLETSVYTKNDERRTSFSIVANEFDFCSNKKGSDANSAEQGFIEDVSDDDLPF